MSPYDSPITNIHGLSINSDFSFENFPKTQFDILADKVQGHNANVQAGYTMQKLPPNVNLDV